jgi:hypothetical protein
MRRRRTDPLIERLEATILNPGWRDPKQAECTRMARELLAAVPTPKPARKRSRRSERSKR